MDFGTLLSVAQKNENNKQPIACYQTKFAPPKKPAKQEKALSVNIKKFLARKEEEEKQKILEEKRKKENLLALRDHKAQSRINKHLKVCKAANKSAIADAIDNENTAVTMAGPSQPDEDDYGYVSQEASAFYNQLMNKYNNAPVPKPLFSETRKRSIKDIASTKDRVKQALKQQEEEEALGHRRKRKSSAKEPEAEPVEQIEKVVHVEEKKEREEKSKPKKKAMPPPMDFNELLKIAEKKQHEPIVIEMKPKLEEPERLMTKKQMMEYAKEKESRERRDHRNKMGKEGTITAAVTGTGNKGSKTQTQQVHRNTAVSHQTNKIAKSNESSISNKTTTKIASLPQSSSKKAVEKTIHENRSNLNKSQQGSSEMFERDILLEERKKLELEKKKLEEMRQAIEEEKKKLQLNRSKIEDAKSKEVRSNKPMMGKLQTKESRERQVASTSVRHKEVPSTNTSVKPRVASTVNERVRQFPPADHKLPIRSKQLPLKDHRRGLPVHKRRIQDEDEEEDYDSELDDFIDDEVEEDMEDYSKHISQIFGYDKSKYKNTNYEDDDDVAMESSFAQQLKEEYVSTKIGIMEDLEDMRMEALEKKRKAMLKKKVKR